MNKKIITLGMSLLLITAPVTVLAQESVSKEVAIKVNGYTIQMYEAPAYIDGKSNLTYVPLRFVSEALGAEIEYINVKTPITTSIDEPIHHEVKVLLDSKKAEFNGKVKTIEGAPVLNNGRTMVPLRVISEGLGAKVKWVPNKGGGGTVEINTPWDTPIPETSVKWEPNSHQKEYAEQVFKLIRFDIKSGDLKIKVPSMKGKDVSAGLSINGKPTSKVTLDTLQEFKGAKKIKLLISISGDYQGGYATFDSYSIYSRDMVPENISASKIPAGDDLIVIDQYKRIVTLSAVLKALDLE